MELWLLEELEQKKKRYRFEFTISNKCMILNVEIF